MAKIAIAFVCCLYSTVFVCLKSKTGANTCLEKPKTTSDKQKKGGSDMFMWGTPGETHQRADEIRAQAQAEFGLPVDEPRQLAMVDSRVVHLIEE